MTKEAKELVDAVQEAVDSRCMNLDKREWIEVCMELREWFATAAEAAKEELEADGDLHDV